jgi:hypothetical protein
MGRSYYKKLKSGMYVKTGYSKTDAEQKKEDSGVVALALLALAGYCIYLFAVYLLGMVVNLIQAINNPFNLNQPLKFLAYYSKYLFFTP